MEMTLLNVLYLVLIAAVVAVGSLLTAALWQLAALLAQARKSILPEVVQVLQETQQNLSNAEGITADVNGKLAKLNGAFDAANSAILSLGETTVMANRTIAKPLMINTAALFAGIKSTAAYLRDHRRDRRPAREVDSRSEREVEPIGL